MFDKFNAYVDSFHKGDLLESGTAECVINSIGITIDEITIPMANIIWYKKTKLKNAKDKYEYKLDVYVLNWQDIKKID